MRRLAFIVVILVGAAGISQWLSVGFSTSWEPALRAFLEENAGRATHTRIHVDAITPAFFHHIRLINVRVFEEGSAQKPFFEAGEIELTVSLIDLPRAILHRRAYEAIGLVSVKNPRLTLSRGQVEKRLSNRASASALPPWFTLIWEGGTFQWLDPEAPRGHWTLYQTHGVFRIRGPKLTFAMRSGVEQARGVRLNYGAFRNRWNAQLRVSEAQNREVLQLAERLFKRRLLPPGWTTGGKFDLDLAASGRRLPAHGRDWEEFLNEGHLTFSADDESFPAPALRLTGLLTYKKNHVTSTNLSIACPWFQGKTHLDVALKDSAAHPEIAFDISAPEGRMGPASRPEAGWPFQNAALQARYVNNHWELLDSSIAVFDGRISAKGYAGAVGSDVAVTAENISLASLFPGGKSNLAKGQLNASCRLKGPLEDWQLSGAWWLTGAAWGQTPIGEARGDLELVPGHFQARAKSDSSRFRFSTEGSYDEGQFELGHFEINLPDSAALTAAGRIDRTTGLVRGTLDISRLTLPQDLPISILTQSALTGTLDMQSKLSGRWSELLLKGTLRSSDLSVGPTPIGKATASYEWSPISFESQFHLGQGLGGRFVRLSAPTSDWSLQLELNHAPTALLAALTRGVPITEGSMDGRITLHRKESLTGQGSMKLEKVRLGQKLIETSTLRVDLKPEQFQVMELTARTTDMSFALSGRASWKGEREMPKHALFEGKGTLQSLSSAHAWAIPFDLEGGVDGEAGAREGRLKIRAPRPLLRNTPVEPIEATLHWTPLKLTWTNIHWGRHWSSEGAVDWSRESPIWSARLKADKIDLQEWQPFLWPGAKKEIRGVLSGDLDLEGPLADLQGGFNAHMDKGIWKSFQFTADAKGRWNGAAGIKPLTVSARLKSGGEAVFSGSLSSDQRAQGVLKVSGFELRPLGESLGFPQPLQGTTTATFTLSGPLTALTWNGHLDGGPLMYGGIKDRAFKLEEVAMDMRLAPLENDPSTARLTLTEAQVKTAEELVRFQSGSYVEFGGTRQPARLRLGMEIRNLHLGIFTLFGGLDLDGQWQVKPEGFSIQTNARTHSLFINDYELEEGLVLADYFNGILRFPSPPKGPSLVTGTINFHAAPELKFTDFFISGKNQEGLQLSGDIGPSLWDFQMVGHGLDMAILGELAGFPYPLGGDANVQVHGTGDPKHPHVEGKIELGRGTALGMAFRSGSAAFIWQDARITFTRLSLSSPGNYALEGSGVIPLVPKDRPSTQDHSIDFSIRLLDSNLSLLQSFSSEIKQAKGPVEGLLQIKGTFEEPSMHGSLRVTNGSIVGAHYFRELRNASLSVDFEGQNILIRELRGRSGEGEFRGSGSVTLAGFQPSRYDFKLAVVSPRGVEVQVPELAIPESPLAKRLRFLTTASRCDVKGNVSLVGPAEAPVFSGTGILSNGHFTFPPSRKNPPSAAVVEWFRRISWDVDLRFQDGAWFDNELVQASVTGNLKLKGPSDKLRVDGGLDINEGKISYLGLQFDVQQARYDIRSEMTGDSVVNTPYVRGVAESQIQAVDTVSGVSGASGGSRLSVNDVITLNIDYAPVDQIKPRLTSASNPTLSQEKLLARVTQTDMENLTPQERSYLYQKQIMSLIDNSLTTPLAQNVLKKTGLADRVRVQHVLDPNSVTSEDLNSASASQKQTSGASLFANTKYTIEKDLSNRLSLGYGIKFVQSGNVDPDFQQQQQQKLDLVSDVQLSYRWFRNIYLKGDFELPTSNPNILPDRKVTIEPRWRFGWWGNTNKNKEKPKASP